MENQFLLDRQNGTKIQSSSNAFGKPLLGFIAYKQGSLAVRAASVSTQARLYGFDCNASTVGEDVTLKLCPGDSKTMAAKFKPTGLRKES